MEVCDIVRDAGHFRTRPQHPQRVVESVSMGRQVCVTRLAYALTLLIGTVGCTKLNPACEKDPQSCGLGADAAIDAAPVCATDQDCSLPTGVCDLPDNMCVQCLPGHLDACTGKTPACGDAHGCVGCRSGADCPATGVCTEDGSCAADAGAIAYIAPAPAGSGTACTMAAPCADLTTAIATGRTTIHIASGLYTITNPTAISTGQLQLIAEAGAEFRRSGNGASIAISGSADVTVSDLTLDGNGSATNCGAITAIANPASGPHPRVRIVRGTFGDMASCNAIDVQHATAIVEHSKIIGSSNGIAGSDASISVTDSVIESTQGNGVALYCGADCTTNSLLVARSQIIGNVGGGILDAGGTMVIVGNLIAHNGSFDTGPGLELSQIGGGSRIEFNTITANARYAQDSTRTGGGLECLSTSSFVARNNIIWANSPDQTSGGCTFAFSDIGPSVTAGGSNLGVDPMFADPTGGDYHLKPTSMLRHAADPAADLSGNVQHDLDGDTRTAPADIGADQVP